MLHKGPGWWVKIADFGISKRIEATALQTRIGTEAYLAPEVKGIYTADSKPEDEETFSLAVDIWSVGAIAFQMVTGRPAFPNGRQLFDYVVREAQFPFPAEKSVSSEYISFIQMTMAVSPPTSRQALRHP